MLRNSTVLCDEQGGANLLPGTMWEHEQLVVPHVEEEHSPV